MSKPYQTVRKDVSKKEPQNLPAVLAQYNRETIPSFRQLRAAFMVLAKDLDDGAFQLGDIVVREVTGTPTSSDPNGSVAFSDTGVFLRILGVWVPLMFAGAVTAGAGLINSASPAFPTIDVVAEDATIVVSPDSIRVGVIGEENTDGSFVTDAQMTEIARGLREEAAHIRVLLLQQIRLELGAPLDNVDGL